MKNFLDPRPEKRKFKYKPRYYESDGGTKDENGNFDPDKFGDRLHRSWSSKRNSQNRNPFPLRTVIWLMCIVFILIFVVYKFMLK